MVRFFSAMDKSCLRGCVVEKLFNVAEFSDEGAILVVLFLLLRDREKEEEKEEEEEEEEGKGRSVLVSLLVLVHVFE